MFPVRIFTIGLYAGCAMRVRGCRLCGVLFCLSCISARFLLQLVCTRVAQCACAGAGYAYCQSSQSVLNIFLNFSFSLPSLSLWVIAWPHSARGGTVCSSGGKSPSGGSRPGAPSPRAGLRAAPSGARPRNDFPSPSPPLEDVVESSVCLSVQVPSLFIATALFAIFFRSLGCVSASCLK